MPEKRRDIIEPNPGDERQVERDERGRFTEQEDVSSPRHGAGRDMERGNVERENVESDDLGTIDVDLESEESDR